MPGAMARDDPPLIVHVFLSSPGDVPEERKAALDLLKAELPYDPLLRGKVMFDVTSWDDRAAPAPMLPTHTPQQSVNRFMHRPGECQIVVVILAGRLGTPLDPAIHSRPDGTPYPSGTVWEFEDALNATPQPESCSIAGRTLRPIVALKSFSPGSTTRTVRCAAAGRPTLRRPTFFAP